MCRAVGRPDEARCRATGWTATGRGYHLQQTRKYDDATRRLSETLIDREVEPTSVSDLHYTYNQAGTITSTSDSTTGDTQCFSYDYLNRLSEA